MFIDTFKHVIVRFDVKPIWELECGFDPFQDNFPFLYPLKMSRNIWFLRFQDKSNTQTISWQFADELFECVTPFCGVGA